MTSATSYPITSFLSTDNTSYFEPRNTTTEPPRNTTTMAPTNLELFNEYYQGIHGYLSVIVCVFGIVTNILNIIVLTRKHMRSPTNLILTALALADMLTMSTYPILAVYYYILHTPNCSTDMIHPASWMNFILFHTLFIITCHNMAMWLTVSLAVFRYIFVCQHTKAATMCSMARAKLTIIIVVIASIISCIPYYFANSVVEDPSVEGCYTVGPSQFSANHPMYVVIVTWLLGISMRILPCILMTLLSTLLILAMQRAKKRRARLLNNVSRIIESDGNSEHNRTTKMLVAVVLCFIITESPQGILMMIGALDFNFFTSVYIMLGDLMDILVLINSAVNFILYCIMSQQFRNTFKSLFVAKHFPPIFSRGKSHPNGADYSMVQTEMTHV